MVIKIKSDPINKLMEISTPPLIFDKFDDYISYITFILSDV